MSKQPTRLPTPPPISSSPPFSLTSSPLFGQQVPLSSPSKHGRSSTDIVARQVEEDGTGYLHVAGTEMEAEGCDTVWTGFTGVPTGIPLASPEQIPETATATAAGEVSRTSPRPAVQSGTLESQETTSTDKLDIEFGDGQDLVQVQVQAEAELQLAGGSRKVGVCVEREEGNQVEAHEVEKPVARKRKRSTTPAPLPPLPTSPSTSRQLSRNPMAIHPSRTDQSHVENDLISQKPELEPAPAPAPDEDTDADAWRYTEDDAYAASKFGGIGEYMRHKRMKLQIQNRAIAESRGGAQYPQIFQGLEIYINGYVRPSLETLRELIMMHGGTYIPYLDRKGMITHIIASNLTPAKFREFSKYKVVLPAWLTDSVERGQLLDWKAYRLVPKGGGEEQGMRGGMSQFLAGAAAKGGADKGKGKERAQVVDLLNEEMVVDHGVPIVQPVPRRLRFEAVPDVVHLPAKASSVEPVTKEDMDTPHPTRSPQPPNPATAKASTTPSKNPHLAPVFFGKSPNSIKQLAAPPKGQSIGLTSDPLTFAHAAAMGYAAGAENMDAKRLMKSAEWREQHTAANEGFLEGYYQNSRLHHLSSWKAELKLLVAQAQSAAESSEIIHTLAPGAVPVPANELSFTDSTLPKAHTRPTTTTIGQGRSNNGNFEKSIFHVDFDAFFVSCGLATRPELRGKPVVVCHSQGTQGSAKDDRNQNATDSGKGSTSEIASCSYEARAKGVKNGMSLGQARRLCPDVQTMPYEFETYKKFSLAFYTILMAYADELQAVSVDEALIDVTSQVQALADAPPEFESSARVSVADEGNHALQDPGDAGDPLRKLSSPLPSTPNQLLDVTEIIPDVSQREAEMEPVKASPDWAKVLAEKIRSDVRKATGCEVSIGIADNILLARLATRHAKPAGSFHLLHEAVPAFMADLEVGELPNFGYSTQQKIMEKFGTKKCGELLGKPKGVLQDVLGNKTGESLYNFIRGIDKRKLEPHKERKSVSAEVNYGIRFISDSEAEQFLINLSKEVAKRLKAIDRLGRLLTLKIMTRHPDAPLEAPKFMGHGVCDVVNKSAILSNGRGGATDDPTHIADTVLGIFRAGKFDSTELRGVGIQVQKLESKSDALPVLEDGQHRLGFAVRAQPEASKADVPPAKEDPIIPPSTIISIPSGNEEDVNPIDSKDIVTAAHRQFFNEPPTRKTSESARMSKFGKRRTTTTTVATAAMLPPAPSEIDPEVWGFLPQEDQSAYRQAWLNQGIKIPRIFMEQPKATTSKLLDEPRVLFPDAQRTTKGTLTRGRSTSVQLGRKQRSESVLSKIKASPVRQHSRSVTPANEEVVDISGSSTPPAPGEYKDADLLALGLDLQVFYNLPRKVQAESYRDAAMSRTTREQLTKKGGHSNPVSPRAAGFKSPHKQTPAIEVQDAPRRPKMNGTSDIETIMDMIREWMDRSCHEEPNQTEVKVIRKYLLRCVDAETAGIGGIQDAARVMGYWRRRCMRVWPKAAAIGSAGNARPGRDIEASWRRAFKEVRREVDDLVQARFGGPLVLP
ncbi:hypothetical protein QFC22_004113 [Naganishia vaughanmartiniae]|uniref:Uncharacterized protein n=1 Tax=Naganishia vaughanmartiniae TaxID=1424756 RepID=A0ACC2X2T7_9TREE|nr:hypothetical protein QFC22_004113 [Naganishia vaughanmartiniae]